MIPQNPTIIPRPFAAEGVAATIPDDKTVFGEASWREGFPTETGLPLNAGGIPPRKADFNGTLKTITEHTFFLQAGCVYPWSDQIDYLVGSHVMGSNSHEYMALKASGPTSTAVDPTTEEESEDMTWLDVTAKLQGGGGDSSGGYEICEFYSFRHPTARSGMVPRYGTLIQNAATFYPQAWAYLQTADGQMLCKTEAEWQAMSTADPWLGVGGVPFFVQDLGAGTLRVPDTRGMYSEDAGFDSLGVGGVHGPGLPNITGGIKAHRIFHGLLSSGSVTLRGAFNSATVEEEKGALSKTSSSESIFGEFSFNAGASNNIYGASTTVRPRSFGVLPCVYLGA